MRHLRIEVFVLIVDTVIPSALQVQSKGTLLIKRMSYYVLWV